MIINQILFGIALLYISIIDIKTKKISNRSLIVAFITGIMVASALSISIFDRITGSMILGMGLWMIDLVRPGAFGGGDIKLLAIAGFLLGIRGGFLALCAAFLSGGIYSALLLLIGKMKRKDTIAFGPFICLGIVLGFVYSL